jgi:hypothetical protein
MRIAFADFVGDRCVRADYIESAHDSATAAFNAAAYNAGFTEPSGREGVISRKSVDGRRERFFITASDDPNARKAVDAFIAYRVSRVLGNLVA